MNNQARNRRDTHYKRRVAYAAIGFVIGAVMLAIGLLRLIGSAPLISAGVRVDLTLVNTLIISGSIITVISLGLFTFFYYTWKKRTP